MDPLNGNPFPNNQIPENRLNSVSRFFLRSIPLPNGPGGQLTFTGTPIVEDEDQFMAKIDFLADRHQLSGRYFFTDFDAPPAIPTENLLAASDDGNAVRVQNVSVNHTYTASPSFLMNTTFGLNIQRGGSLSSAPFGFADAGVNILGPEHTSLNAPPEIILTVSGFFQVRTDHLGDFNRGDFTVREVVTQVLGAHELRYGGEAVRVDNDIVNTFQMAGRFTFNGQLSGHALADFLLGRASEFRQGGGEFKDLRGTRWGFFVQDNWKMTPRLALNLGLRWDPYLPYYDRQGRVVCFQPNSGQRSQRFPNAPVGLLYGGENHDPGCPVAGSEANWWNLAPRFGLAYRLSEDGKTSLRVGAGLYYTPIQTSNRNPFTNIAPFAGTFTLNDVAFEDPYGSKGMENPFPANFGPEIPGPDFIFAPINDIRAYFARDYRIPQLLTWSLRLERQLGRDWVASAAYLGNKGTYLQLTVDENPAVYRPGVDERGNPLSTVGNIQARRIYPNFGRVRRTDSGANSSYHALQLNLERRFAQNFSILTNYTWSKTLDDLSAANPFDRRFEWALSDQDVSHNFKFSNLFEVPRVDLFGLADKLVNGWQLNSSLVWQSGFPFTVVSGRDNSFSGVGQDRADFLGGDARLPSGRSRGEEIQRWFDTSRFTRNQPGTFGTAGRNILRGPGFFNVDLGILKSSRLGEEVTLQFRAEAFNLLNNVNFRLPNSNVSSSQFGRITQVVEDSQRIIQFGLKILF